MSLSEGKQWPVAITAGIILVIAACVVTVYVAFLQPMEEDTDLMLDYHTLDAHVNDLIAAEISFNRKYHLSYIGEGVSEQGSTISYKIEDTEGNPVDMAKITLSIVRPIVHSKDITLSKPRIENGNYYFDNVKVPQKGRWNILAKVSVGEYFRHMNLKSDTMDKNVYEYGLNKPMRNSWANNSRTVQ